MRSGPIFNAARRRRLAAGLALAVAVAVVGAIVVGTGSSSSKPGAHDPVGVSGATTVQRRDLVQTDTESGTLSYADPHTVYNRLSGTITWLPAAGQVIRPGQALFKIDNQPVILMDGSTPAYRALSSSDGSGPDIGELNRNLVQLGFNPGDITVDDTWQPATTAGVEALQASLGETQTGSLSLGRVVFLPGPQLISTVDGTVGSTGGSSGSPSNASLLDPVARPEFVSLTTTSAAPTSTTTTPNTTPPKRKPGNQPKSSHPNPNQQTLAALVALLRAEVAELGHSPHGNSGHSPGGSSGHPSGSGSPSGSHNPSGSGNPSGSHNPSGSDRPSGSDSPGGGGGSAQEILQTTSTQLIVTVDLSATVQSEAVVGERVTVEMPDGGTVEGRITKVSSVAQSSSGSGGGSSPTIPVTIRLLGHVAGAGLDQAAVSVEFAQAKARNVLSVPVTALLATSGNTYAVQEAAPPYRLISVTTGLFAAGYVQVSGAGIYPGLQVTDSQG